MTTVRLIKLSIISFYSPCLREELGVVDVRVPHSGILRSLLGLLSTTVVLLDPIQEPKGREIKCIYDLYPIYIGDAAANVTTDVVILIVPIPLVWTLHIRTSAKIMVTSIFILGGLYFSSFLYPGPGV